MAGSVFRIGHEGFNFARLGSHAGSCLVRYMDYRHRLCVSLLYSNCAVERSWLLLARVPWMGVIYFMGMRNDATM